MKQLKLYQVDAFAEQAFSGNPAAVVVLSEWLDVALMQNIALENNLSETAFIIPEQEFYHIRYFTPLIEVELCGHATLASAFVVFNFLEIGTQKVCFRTQNRGDLYISKHNSILNMDFPTDKFESIEPQKELIDTIGIIPTEAFWGLNDVMLVYDNEDQIKAINPNFEELKDINTRGVLITAPGDNVDFVSRFFAPKAGINEDPVTGSAHTTLIPYWSKRLNKTKMIAKQLSKRGGTIYCENRGNRVSIGGKAIHYLTGNISL